MFERHPSPASRCSCDAVFSINCKLLNRNVWLLNTVIYTTAFFFLSFSGDLRFRLALWKSVAWEKVAGIVKLEAHLPMKLRCKTGSINGHMATQSDSHPTVIHQTNDYRKRLTEVTALNTLLLLYQKLYFLMFYDLLRAMSYFADFFSRKLPLLCSAMRSCEVTSSQCLYTILLCFTRLAKCQS